MIGDIIQDYRIESLLGQGGIGKVYLAKHIMINRTVAIKVLGAEYGSIGDFRQNFIKAAELMSNLRNQNIVDFIGFDSSRFAIIMEYIAGYNLQEYIKKVKRGPISEQESVEIFKQVLSAVQYAHNKNMVHLDIKPANIMRANNGPIKVLDFDIARIIQDSRATGNTITGKRIGTPKYMSPEQVRARAIDYRSDIYSLGVTLYEMVTGSTLYQDDLSEYDISYKIVNEDLPDPQHKNPEISRRLADAILKATKKDPFERFQSCDEFLRAISNDNQQPIGEGTTILPTKTVKVILTDDKDAHIYLNDQGYFKKSQKFIINPSETIDISVKREGYKDYHRSFHGGDLSNNETISVTLEKRRNPFLIYGGAAVAVVLLLLIARSIPDSKQAEASNAQATDSTKEGKTEVPVTLSNSSNNTTNSNDQDQVAKPKPDTSPSTTNSSSGQVENQVTTVSPDPEPVPEAPEPKLIQSKLTRMKNENTISWNSELTDLVEYVELTFTYLHGDNPSETFRVEDDNSYYFKPNPKAIDHKYRVEFTPKFKSGNIKLEGTKQIIERFNCN